ncbi:phage antirepressor KilAC domain-containing protein [Mesoterricola sediminis]|uniref:Bro-N domain-containing protein n=1 Tax=Mesoterricola sediminis TaxID=2927980 RepID=A0AA48KCP4_9BACT|nr:phage antirepressor KilAC domain-containing protein [Mesoterricola sediminis]BDU76265.1 hypothetical protein METESE_12230 [Mesoterricola sediminis]
MDIQSINTFSFGVNPIRVIVREGDPWFVASDVCAVLDHGNPRQVISRLDEDEKGVHIMDTLGGRQQMAIISESGLYSLVLTSRKPEARTFKKWVTSDVLPTIRRTGAYSIQGGFQVPQTLPEALRLAADLEEKRYALACKVESQAEEIQVLEPKAAAADAITRADDSLSMSEAAKTLGIGRQRLFDKMRAWGWIIPGSGDPTPYQVQIDRGNVTVRVIHYEDQHGRDRIYPKILITGKGLIALHKKLAQERGAFMIRPQHQREAS